MIIISEYKLLLKIFNILFGDIIFNNYTCIDNLISKIMKVFNPNINIRQP